ncbi:XRE family transcriptional regulator [Streptomyces kasugaensis]|uniref:XRE family transcriptional regulator n=1 Tax=Streptomyces kasugaensis TaxID=1946 RepID=A0A4Q9HXS7_STRKA|nr:XRE family transcriptional regulator [Streptomyces kasugaensis]TBO60057.1 XRE family transcriptional regulator [Streptomyces kasugaensis]
MPTLIRKSEGRPLRAAMKAAGMSGPKLAAATKVIDPGGRGISPAIVGRLAGRGATARERCRPRTARLIAEVLHQPLNSLFVMPASSTDTVERSTPHGDDH